MNSEKLNDGKEDDAKEMSIQNTSMLFSAQWNLSKYAKWIGGDWKLLVPDGKELLLMIKDLQLLVVYGDIALESYSLAQSKNMFKSIYNNGTLVVAVKCQDKGCKFRVLFSSLIDGEKCVIELRKYVNVQILEGSRPIVDKSQQSLPVIMAKILNRQDHSFPVPRSIPNEYPLEAAVRLCILDPGFPALVEKIESIIKEHDQPPENPKPQ